jgi:SUN family beta-glucosidase
MGYYILGPESSPPTSTSPLATTPQAPSSSAAPMQFYEEPPTTSVASTTVLASSTTATSSIATSSTTTTSSTTSSTTTLVAAATQLPSTGGIGLDSSFPSGSIPCSTFPSAYGAVAADWLGLSDWIGVQTCPSYSPGAESISDISTVPVGSDGGCVPNSFCSYMCPPGYQKSQWPSAQGSAGQSIGGLYCNSHGILELSRPSVSQLCVPGTGEVVVENTLGNSVSVCRTDYPGTESMTVAMSVLPGETNELTCPYAEDYYMWNNQFTSAQYYVNPSGVSTSIACQWQNSNTPGDWWGAPGNCGNWAPVNLGAGRGPTGETFISMFPNFPTNPTGCLDFDIKITGDVSGDCAYKNGSFYSNDVLSPTGCTVSFGINESG